MSVLAGDGHFFDFIRAFRETLRRRHGCALGFETIELILLELNGCGMLRMTNTIRGVPCLPRVTIYTGICKKCERHILSINDIVVADNCRCLNRTVNKGNAIDVRTADVIDALGVQFDDPPEISHERSIRYRVE